MLWRMQMFDMSEDMVQLSKDLGQLPLEIEAFNHQVRDIYNKLAGPYMEASSNEFEIHVKAATLPTNQRVQRTSC